MSDSLDQLQEILTKTNQLLEKLLPASTQSGGNDSGNANIYYWNADNGATPIDWGTALTLDDLLHIDWQKLRLLENTAQFVHGLPANNALLWGSRGTGKSSLIQALLHHYASTGLCAIEMSREHINDWADMLQWAKRDGRRFIAYCDDLSFDAGDHHYKTIKAVLDGSLRSLPENVIVYATSNRRHLLPEYMSDNQSAQHIEGEIHHSEAVEEAISLSDRFGLWLSFHAFTQDQYLDAVRHWLNKYSNLGLPKTTGRIQHVYPLRGAPAKSLE